MCFEFDGKGTCRSRRVITRYRQFGRLASNSGYSSYGSATPRPNSRELKALPEQEKQVRKLSCFICREATHIAKECPKKKKCFVCGQNGHQSFECKQKRVPPNAANNAFVQAKEKPGEQRTGLEKQASRFMSVIEDNNQLDSITKFCKEVTLAEKHVLNGLIDPGSAVCIIRASAVLNNNLNVIEK